MSKLHASGSNGLIFDSKQKRKVGKPTCKISCRARRRNRALSFLPQGAGGIFVVRAGDGLHGFSFPSLPRFRCFARWPCGQVVRSCHGPGQRNCWLDRSAGIRWAVFEGFYEGVGWVLRRGSLNALGVGSMNPLWGSMNPFRVHRTRFGGFIEGAWGGFYELGLGGS